MKEKINKQNYEIWFIDFLDQKLNQDEIAELTHFLKEYPDLAEELDGLSGVSAPSAEVTFENKVHMKKTLNDMLPHEFDSFDDFMIAKLEGDLDLSQQKRFITLLDDDTDFAKEYSFFEQTQLKANNTIVFPAKSGLKRGLIFQVYRNSFSYTISLAAAAILLLIALTINIKYLDSNFLFSDQTATLYPDVDISGQQVMPIYRPRIIVQATSYQAPINSAFLKENVAVQNSGLSKKPEKQTLPEKSIVPGDELTLIEFPEKRENNNFRFEHDILEKEPEINTDKINPKDYLKRKFRIRAFNSENEKDKNERITIWELAEAGVKGIGKLLKKDIDLQRDYDENGKLIGIEFNTPGLALSAPINKK
ncbi:hypothetical protein ACFLRI_04695 [Bacteroidota bacterium]